MNTDIPHSPDGIVTVAREVFDASGKTQTAVAEMLDVSQPSVARALSGASNLHGVRVRIIEALTPYQVVGPEYRLVER